MNLPTIRHEGSTFQRHPDPQFRGLAFNCNSGNWWIWHGNESFSLHHGNEIVAMQDYMQWLLNPDYRKQIEWRNPRARLKDIGDLVERWIEDMAMRHVQKSTRRTCRYAMRRLLAFVEAETSKKPNVVGMTTEQIRRWILSLELAGYAPNTIAVNYRKAAEFFRWADREGVLRENPMRTIKEPRTEKNVTDRAAMYIAPHEASQLFVSEPTYRAPMMALYLTAMRPAEFWGLRKENVHLEHPGGPQIYLAKSKTKKGRAVPLCDEVCAHAVMSSILARLDGVAPSRKKFRIAFGAETERVLGRHITPYALRHSAITNWVQQGNDPFAVATWAGTSQAVIQEHYYHCQRAKAWPGNPLKPYETARIQPGDPWPDRGPIEELYAVQEYPTTKRRMPDSDEHRPAIGGSKGDDGRGSDPAARGRRALHSTAGDRPLERFRERAFDRAADGRFCCPGAIHLRLVGGSRNRTR